MRVKLIDIGPNSRYLAEFYKDVFIPAFPDKNEREPLTVLMDSLRPHVIKPADIVENINQLREVEIIAKNLSHVIIAIHNGKVIGGVAFNFFGCANNTCFGIIWWIVVRPEYRRKKIGRRLVRAAYKTLQNASEKLGYKNLDGILVEINNPAKMLNYGFLLEKDLMDPYQRIKFWRTQGYLQVKDFDYIQLTSNPKSFVEYCDLYILPIKGGEWASCKLNGNDLLTIISYIASLGSNLKGLTYNKQFMKMVASIRKNKQFELV